jgi:hypothetical protein
VQLLWLETQLDFDARQEPVEFSDGAGEIVDGARQAVPRSPELVTLDRETK